MRASDIERQCFEQQYYESLDKNRVSRELKINNQINMKVIKLAYDSAQIYPSLILISFFRLFGFYVYEVFTDIDRIGIKKTIYDLTEGEPGSYGWEPYVNEFDINIELLSNKNDLEFIQANELDYNTIFILPDDNKRENNNNLNIVYYNNNTSELLTDLVSAMNKIKRDEKIYNSLKKGIDIFLKYNLTGLSLSTTYFYPASNDEEFEKYKNIYRSSVKELSAILKDNNCGWEDTELLPIKHAILKLGYEANWYCLRSKRFETYDNGELLELCNSMIKRLTPDDDYRGSIGLLKTQIIDELLFDKNVSYDFYVMFSTSYNAFANFRLGEYWRETHPDRAIVHYLGSVVSYPTYYRAWYRLAICYMEMGYDELALQAFSTVISILEPKFKTLSIRPMEIEYLLKALNFGAETKFKCFGNPHDAIIGNELAIDIWKSIDKTKSYDLIYDQNDALYLRNKNKQNLSLKKVYKDLMEAYKCLRDDEMVRKYEKKYIFGSDRIK